MIQFFVENGTLTGCELGGETRVTVPDGVQRIGEDVFRDCTALESVVLPESVVSIEDNALRDCPALRHVTLPEWVGYLGNAAFFGCEALEEVRLPEGLAEVGDLTFAGCTQLRRISLPPSLTAIGEAAFFGCRALEEIFLPAGLRTIGWSAFQDCTALRELRLPAEVSLIGMDALKGCRQLQQVFLAGEDPFLAERLVRTLSPDQVCAPRVRCPEHPRVPLLVSYLHGRERGIVYEEAEHWRALIRREKEGLWREAAKDGCVLRALVHEQLLSRAEAQALLAAADTEGRVLLLDYLHRVFPAGEENGAEEQAP